MSGVGGLISAVRPGTIGAEVGLEPGDRLLGINGHALCDVLDYRFYAAEEHLLLLIERDGVQHCLDIERDEDERLGLAFAEPLFDGLRRCRNRCSFCFVSQLPPGLRPSLYVHDDDYRHSFLRGSYITLTNLDEGDWVRIGAQRLSPLYVSVHSTELAVRSRLLGVPSPDIIAQLRRLGDMHIALHTQVVICPEINDGAVLERTIGDLLALWPTVRSLALVPLGLTRYHRGGLRPLRSEEAASVLDLAARWQARVRARTGRTWLYAADELYLLAGREVPPAAHYDDDAQRENGVGLVRELLDDWRRLRRRLDGRAAAGGERSARAVLACGRAIAPLLQASAAELERLTGSRVRVVAVENRLFGPTVTVSGLLAGADVLAALPGPAGGERVFVPRSMFSEEGLTLDGLTREQLAERLAASVLPVSRWSEVWRALA